MFCFLTNSAWYLSITDGSFIHRGHLISTMEKATIGGVPEVLSLCTHECPLPLTPAFSKAIIFYKRCCLAML